MRRFGWQWLVISSLVSVALAAVAETRPLYGGTLRVTTHSALTSLDPAEGAQPDSFARRSVTRLIFETLVAIDGSGAPKPALAASWQANPAAQRWEIRLRQGVKFHDGTVLTPEIAASSLRAANPSWNVSASADAVIVERDSPDAELPAELALPRNAIVKRNPEGKLSGTGPFHIADWQPGKKLSLAAQEDYWRGRPFLDAVEIEMGKTFRDQQTALELGKAELAEVAPEQSHRLSAEGRLVASSAPMEFVALLFSRNVSGPEDELLRQALALSVGRAAIRRVLLQGAGQTAGSILPNWMSGYGFVFSTEPDLARARHQREQVRRVPTWTLGYDASDSMARLLAERVTLNARDAGLTLQLTAGATADLRLARVPLASGDPWISLTNLAAISGLPVPKVNAGSVEDLYSAERSMLATQRLIPLFHLPVSYAAAPALKNWTLRSDGEWDLASAWLGTEKP